MSLTGPAMVQLVVFCSSEGRRTLDRKFNPHRRPGFDPRSGRCVVSLSKRHLLPKSTGNTQE